MVMRWGTTIYCAPLMFDCTITALKNVQVTTTNFSGEVILYYLSNIIYTNSTVLIAMYDCC